MDDSSDVKRPELGIPWTGRSCSVVAGVVGATGDGDGFPFGVIEVLWN